MTSDAILNGTPAVRASVGHRFESSLTDANHTRLHIDVIDVGNYAVKRRFWVLMVIVSPSNVGSHSLNSDKPLFLVTQQRPHDARRNTQYRNK